METINQLIHAIGNLREESPNSLQQCKNALDSVFLPDAKCFNFIYTRNTDKLPFICIVMPVIPSQTINNLIISGDPIRFKDYEIELDSKVFDYGFSDEQIAEIMLYNIYHMIKDNSPAEKFREELDKFLTENGTQIIIKDSIQYQAILAFGLQDTLVHCTNCLYADSDINNDAFLMSLGFDDFDQVLNKLFQRMPGIDNSATRGPQLSMLKWALRLYNDVKKSRIGAIKIMNRCKEITASTLYRNKMDLVIAALNRIDTDSLLAEATYFKEAKEAGTLVSQIKYSGLRSIEDDIIEFKIRIQNIVGEDEALNVLKALNVRLTILDDYIRSESSKNDKDLQRWEKLYGQYHELRDSLADKDYEKTKSLPTPVQAPLTIPVNGDPHDERFPNEHLKYHYTPSPIEKMVNDHGPVEIEHVNDDVTKPLGKDWMEGEYGEFRFIK